MRNKILERVKNNMDCLDTHLDNIKDIAGEIRGIADNLMKSTRASNNQKAVDIFNKAEQIILFLDFGE